MSSKNLSVIINFSLPFPAMISLLVRWIQFVRNDWEWFQNIVFITKINIMRNKSCLLQPFSCKVLILSSFWQGFIPGCWKQVGSRPELRGMLVRACRVSIYSTLWYVEVPLNRPRYVHVPLVKNRPVRHRYILELKLRSLSSHMSMTVVFTGTLGLMSWTCCTYSDLVSSPPFILEWPFLKVF